AQETGAALMAWHYIVGGKIVGPLSPKAFEALRHDLDPGTLVWADGMKEWQRLEGVPEEHQAGPLKRRHLTPARSKAAPMPAPPAPSPSPYAGFGPRLGAL